MRIKTIAFVSNKALKSNIIFDGGGSQYSSSAKTARDASVSTYNWTITDGGLAP
jgi:hypothetical protein